MIVSTYSTIFRYVMRYPLLAILFPVLFTKSLALDTSPPDTKTPCGDNSENMCDLPVPLGPNSMKL